MIMGCCCPSLLDCWQTRGDAQRLQALAGIIGRRPTAPAVDSDRPGTVTDGSLTSLNFVRTHSSALALALALCPQSLHTALLAQQSSLLTAIVSMRSSMCPYGAVLADALRLAAAELWWRGGRGSRRSR